MIIFKREINIKNPFEDGNVNIIFTLRYDKTLLDLFEEEASSNELARKYLKQYKKFKKETLYKLKKYSDKELIYFYFNIDKSIKRKEEEINNIFPSYEIEGGYYIDFDELISLDISNDTDYTCDYLYNNFYIDIDDEIHNAILESSDCE